uniref:Skp1-related protein n=1 Tax=Glossina austeni TaxID=7395 RepID=A0A1A9UF33_GLOAU
MSKVSSKKIEAKQIDFQSSDNEFFNIDVQVAKCSGRIKTFLEDCGMRSGDNVIVPLPNVNSEILRQILNWANYHKDDPQPNEDDRDEEKRTDDISLWDAEFLKVDQGILFHLIMAANYRDIKGLFDITCQTVANMMKGKTSAEIRETFNIRNDFTPAEEEPIGRENEWCEQQ